MITAFDYLARGELDTEEILYNGKPLGRLAADESFPYVGVHASLVESRKRCAFSPSLVSEKVFSAAKELVGIAKDCCGKWCRPWK